MTDGLRTQTAARYSVLDLAPLRLGGSVAEALANSLDLARHAERWGYTRFWLAEHHNMPGIASAATAVLICHIAGGTRTIRVGSGGVMLPNHAALMVAEQFGTLEALFPGRIDLGLGRAPGSDRMAARAMRRGLHGGEEEFPAQVAELLAYFAPVQPGQRLQAVPGGGAEIPVWLLGSSTYSARLAAQMGLPFGFASHFAPDLLLDAIRIYRAEFQPSERLAAPYLIAGMPVVVADSDAEARRLATSPAQRHLALIRGEPIFIPPPVDCMDGLWSDAERETVEARQRVAAIGGPETVRRQIAAFLSATKADELMFTSDVWEHSARLRSFELAARAMGEFGV